MFAPLAFEPGLGRHITSKVQRWAMYLSWFTYVIKLVAGDANVLQTFSQGGHVFTEVKN